MPTLYVKEQGASVVKRGEQIVILKQKMTLLEIPLSTIDSIAIIGNVQITTQALQMLMEAGIDISYFTRYGKYLGHTVTDSSKNVFLRFAQYELYQNLERRMDIARIIVENKVKNQMTLMRKYRWDGRYQAKDDLRQMERVLDTLPTKQTPNSILGVEGMCSNIYLGVYGHMFKSKIRFEGRNRRPPRDPINVILSLGYSFLTKDVSAALEAESFETYMGFLHGIRYGRKSLALDIVEEFRQPVIDRLVLRSFNLGIFSERDFYEENDRIVLGEEGFAKFCQNYENWMKDRHQTGIDRSFSDQIKNQARELKKAISEKREYIPFSWKECLN